MSHFKLFDVKVGWKGSNRANAACKRTLKEAFNDAKNNGRHEFADEEKDELVILLDRLYRRLGKDHSRIYREEGETMYLEMKRINPR